MPQVLDALLLSLPSLAVSTYWIIALLVALEATVLVGTIVPGMLAVVAGGMLVQGGSLQFADLAWFVAAGAALGGEVSYHLGRRAAGGTHRWTALTASLPAPRFARRAAALLERCGGAALVVGRFRGPFFGFVPVAAALAGMSAARFRLWNLLGAVPYALLLPALGYASGEAIATLGAAAPRAVAFGLAALAMLGILWLLVRRIRRVIPLLLGLARAIRATLSDRPAVRAVVRRHPRLAGFLVARFGTERFLGLTATVLGVLFLYIATVWAESVFDFLGEPGVRAADTRLANLLHGMRDARLVAILGWITDAGGRHGVLPMLAGTSVALLVLRRFDLLGGLWIAAIGNQLTVTLLKALFARPRSDLGYFVETSGSFPSGHAAGAVAFWAMLFYLGWRLRVLPAGVAATAAASLAFAIGLSRVYLVEHYLSDVLNGYLVGGLWLILGAAFCEWRQGAGAGLQGAGAGGQGAGAGGHGAGAAQPEPSPARRAIAAASVAAAACVVIWLATVTTAPLNETVEPDPQSAARAGSLLEDTSRPRGTETLTGAPRQRVNLIATAPDAAALTSALEGAGWTFAPPPGPGLLAVAAFDRWTERALPDPLVVPTFWDDRPSAPAFARTGAGGLRLHLRFWVSGFRSDDGATIFAATLTEEDPLDWVFEEANEDPPVEADVAAPLDRLAADLRAAGIGVELPR